jgi:hypothetical protein
MTCSVMRLWKDCLAHGKDVDLAERDPDLVKCVQLCLAYTATTFQQDSIDIESCIEPWIRNGLLSALCYTGLWLTPDLVSDEFSQVSVWSDPIANAIFMRNDLILEHLWHATVYQWLQWGAYMHVNKGEYVDSTVLKRLLDYREVARGVEGLGSTKTCHFSQACRSRACNGGPF